MEAGLLGLSLAMPLGLLVLPDTASGQDRPFTSMEIAREDEDTCRVPKPPVNLAETAYLRNGYRAILRILIAEDALASDTCTCLLGDFTWDQALDALPRFQTSDNPRLPFNVLELYAQADALEAEVIAGCAK
jgi:hypothetical protein